MKNISEFFPEWNECIRLINQGLANEIGEPWARVDEVAVMLPSALDAFKWISESVKADEVELFNKAEDVVVTHPFSTEYDVNYWFLTTPYDYRVEAMSLAGGLSPLHEAIKPHHHGQNEYPVTVHFSFKCPDPETYKRAIDWFSKAEWVHVQSCDSTYGSFSYWLASENVDPQSEMPYYVKPRVNRRDQLGQSTLDGYLSKKAGS